MQNVTSRWGAQRVGWISTLEMLIQPKGTARLGTDTFCSLSSVPGPASRMCEPLDRPAAGTARTPRQVLGT